MMFFPWMYALSFIFIVLGWPFFLLDYPEVFWACLLINTSIFFAVARFINSDELSLWRGLRILCGFYMSGCANLTLLYIFFVLMFYYIEMMGATWVGIRRGKAHTQQWWIKTISKLQSNNNGQANDVSFVSRIQHGYPNIKVIRNSIKLLYQNLSRETIEGFSTSISPSAVSMPSNEDIIIAVQRIASNIAKHLHLPVGIILVNFRPSLQHAGQVELTSEDDYLVELHTRYRDDDRDIPAILAHELTHVFLHRAGLRFPITHDNEILTDTTAVYLGIGWMCLNAYRKTVERYDSSMGAIPGQVNTATREEKLGYLTPEEFGYVLAKRSLALNEKVDYLLTSTARKAYKDGLRMAIADYKRAPLSRCGFGKRILYLWHRRYIQNVYRKSKLNGSSREFNGYRFDVAETIKVAFDCPVCFQKLRVPIAKGKIAVQCSVCGTALNCRT